MSRSSQASMACTTLTDGTSKVVTVKRLDVLDLERVNVQIVQSKESNRILLVSTSPPNLSRNIR